MFTSMMPTTIQEHIYSTVEKDTQYSAVKEKVRAMIQNKLAANSGPVPMDIGEVGRMDEGLWGYHEDFIEEYNVDAVDMNTKCFRCQGYGHMSTDCATKSDKGKGKVAEEKSGYKGKGKGDDGKGYGKRIRQGWR